MQIPLILQFVNLLASILLLVVFAMLAQRRILSLINLFAWQGGILALSTFVVAYSTRQHHLYYSAGLTLVLKVLLLPWLLHRLIRKLQIRQEVETLINIPTTMLVGIGLVIFSFNLAAPIAELAQGITRGLIGIALASVLLSLLMMMTLIIDHAYHRVPVAPMIVTMKPYAPTDRPLPRAPHGADPPRGNSRATIGR